MKDFEGHCTYSYIACNRQTNAPIIVMPYSPSQAYACGDMRVFCQNFIPH